MIYAVGVVSFFFGIIVGLLIALCINFSVSSGGKIKENQISFDKVELENVGKSRIKPKEE